MEILSVTKIHGGMLVGTILGAAIAIGGAMISGVLMGAGIAASCIGIGVLAIGASIAVGYGTTLLADWVRDKCVETGSKSLSPCGEILDGSKIMFVLTASLPQCPPVATSNVIKKTVNAKSLKARSSVYINGFPASRVGDKTTCDATIMEGSPMSDWRWNTSNRRY